MEKTRRIVKKILERIIKKKIIVVDSKKLAIYEKGFKNIDSLNFFLYGYNIIQNTDYIQSQALQDLFVLTELDFKKNGYFVEFGATNGVDHSNTFLLEKRFNWTGIVAEAGKLWHSQLLENRNCKIELDCVWSKTGEKLKFNETNAADLSTIDTFSDSDSHKELRKQGKKYYVNTISLNDLLAKYNAPKKIDYLSIDTEGSELEILSNFDFNSYKISIITCEHNYTSYRSKIYKLLISKGYERKFEGISKFDDWYVLTK